MKKFNLVLMFVFIIFITGCTIKPDVKKLNSEWKSKIAQIQITPVMPLRERIELGEVYRFLRKPPSYYEDGQMEPNIAFIIPVDDTSIRKNQSRRWPYFTFSGTNSIGLGASVKSVGMFSGSMSSEGNITVQIGDSYSESVTVDKIISSLCEINSKGEMIIKKNYEDSIVRVANYVWKWMGSKYKRNVIFLRIPVEVYYAKSVNVSFHGTKNFDAEFELDKLDKHKLAELNITTIYRSNETVVMNENLSPPMAVGYRGILLRVTGNTPPFKVENFPEDANLEFWSDL